MLAQATPSRACGSTKLEATPLSAAVLEHGLRAKARALLGQAAAADLWSNVAACDHLSAHA
jgi:hypothetical protein